MQFKKLEDGSCDLIFSEEEIKILNKNKKITFTAEGLRDFGNNLVKIVADWNMRFNKVLQNKSTHSITVYLEDDV